MDTGSSGDQLPVAPLAPSRGSFAAGNVLQALLKDQTCANSAAGFSFRETYLSNALASSGSMYSIDIRGHHGCVNALAFSKGQEQYLSSGGDDQRVLVWRVADVLSKPKSHQPLCMNSRHTSNIFTLDFSCDNSYLFSGGEDKELIVHDFKTGHTISSFEHTDAVYCVASHPSSPEVVYTASEDGCVYIIDTRVARRQLGQDLLLCEALDSYQCVAVNPVEPVLVATSNTRLGSSLYDLRSKKMVLSYNSTDGFSFRHDGVSVSFNSSGKQVYSMYRRHPPTLHNLWSSDPVCYFSDSEGGYRNTITMKSGCFMGQQDEYVVSGSDDFRVFIWKVPTSEEVQVAREEAASSSASSPSASRSSGFERTSPHLVLPGHRSIVNQTRYSSVNRILVTSGVEKIVKVWSNMPIHSGHTLQHSGDPPARQRFTASELRSVMSGSSSEPTDPADEDIKVLALFDSLMEEDGLSDDSDDNLSVYSDLFFPFWRRPTLFPLNSDSDSELSMLSDRFSDELESFYDSFEDEIESDSSSFDGWHSLSEEAEEEEEEDNDDRGRVGGGNGGNRGGCNDNSYIDRFLRHAASIGIFADKCNCFEHGGNMERSVAGDGGSNFDGVCDGDSANLPTICGTRSGEGTSSGCPVPVPAAAVPAATAATTTTTTTTTTHQCLPDCVEERSQEEQVAKGKGPASATNLVALKSKNKGKGSSSSPSASHGGCGASSREETNMKLRSREIQVPITKGYNRKRKTPSRVRTSSDAAAASTNNGDQGACALDSAPTLPLFIPHVVDLPGTSERDASPGPSDNSACNAGSNGRTTSKRKKLLDSRARCDNGFQDKYVAEEFLRTKSPTNFYSSKDNSKGKEGSRGRKKKGGPGSSSS